MSLPHGHNPQFVIKRYRTAGWDADINTKRLCRCPECAKKIKGGGHPMEAAKVATTSPLPLAIVTGPKPVAAAPPPPAAAPVAEPPRVLPGIRVRLLLEEHFDEKLGRYLDGYSDKRVADEAACTLALVNQIRDLSFGPVLGDAELDEILAELGKLGERLWARERALGIAR